jgi:hypothetical protein
MATSVGDLQNKTVEYNLSTENVQKGYMALAASTEEGQEALRLYNYEMSRLDPTSTEAAEATAKF